MFPDDILDLAQKLINDCENRSWLIATAESCTGGLIAGCLTAVAGSSAVFERGFNTYSNEAKAELLAVSLADIANHGAVSEIVAGAMAEGALAAAPVHLTVAVTGVAGPGGGTPEKPVGTVQIASAAKGRPTLNRVYLFPGDRQQVRMATVREALKMMAEQL